MNQEIIVQKPFKEIKNQPEQLKPMPIVQDLTKQQFIQQENINKKTKAKLIDIIKQIEDLLREYKHLKEESKFQSALDELDAMIDGFVAALPSATEMTTTESTTEAATITFPIMTTTSRPFFNKPGEDNNLLLSEYDLAAAIQEILNFDIKRFIDGATVENSPIKDHRMGENTQQEKQEKQEKAE